MSSRSLQRAASRTLASMRRSAARTLGVLRRPSQWRWGRIGAGGAVLAVGGCALVLHERSRGARLCSEDRRFTEGSPLQAIESSLSTGDVLLFSRAVSPLDDTEGVSLHPLRFAVVLAQKIAGGSEYDHIAVVVRRNDYPYVLERSWNGDITVSSKQQASERANREANKR